MNFYQFVDKEVEKGLPADSKRIASDKLLGREPIKIRHAFQTKPVNSKSRLVNLLVLPPELQLSQRIEGQIIKLQNYILSRDCVMIVVQVEEEKNTLGNIGGFIEDSMAINNPNLLWLRCIANIDYQASVIYDQYEDLFEIIRDVWNGSLSYKGPIPGFQKVNIELMKDECWSCHAAMKTVTGIVFPNMQLSNWSNFEWKYYNQLFPLSGIEGKNAQIIYDFIEKLRTIDKVITPVGDRYSRTQKASYLAASCPHCGALRGDFHVSDYRMQFLHSLKSRLNGSLQYYSIGLFIEQAMLDELASGYEGCDHTTGPGWER